MSSKLVMKLLWVKTVLSVDLKTALQEEMLSFSRLRQGNEVEVDRVRYADVVPDDIHDALGFVCMVRQHLVSDAGVHFFHFDVPQRSAS